MRFFLVCLCILLSGGSVWKSLAETPVPIQVASPIQLRTQLGLGRFESAPPRGLEQVKIAVLDRGFADLRAEDLPASARVETFAELTPRSPGLDVTAHGAAMARIIWAVTGQHREGPQFYLLNANGLTNFRRAIDFVIREKIAIVLHAHNWEFGGNFDGKGFIDAEVSRATQAGVLWIAAAGGYGGKVRNGSLQAGFKQSRCLVFENRFDRNLVRATLAWNDFVDTEAYATSKDLALALYRVGASGNPENDPVLIADRKQSGMIPLETEQVTTSAHAREILELELPRGRYCLQVQARSLDWTAQDRFRITLSSVRLGADALAWEQSPPSSETPGEIMIPADHPDVVTVGDRSAFSGRGPTQDGRAKPEIVLPFSEIRFTDGTLSAGTSNAAALVAGWAAVHFASSEAASWNRDEFLNRVQKQRPDWMFSLANRKTDDEKVPLALIGGCGLSPDQVLNSARVDGRLTVWISRGRNWGATPNCLISMDEKGQGTLPLRSFVRFQNSAGAPEFAVRQSASPGRVVFSDERWGAQAWVELVLVP